MQGLVTVYLYSVPQGIDGRESGVAQSVTTTGESGAVSYLSGQEGDLVQHQM